MQQQNQPQETSEAVNLAIDPRPPFDPGKDFMQAEGEHLNALIQLEQAKRNHETVIQDLQTKVQANPGDPQAVKELEEAGKRKDEELLGLKDKAEIAEKEVAKEYQKLISNKHIQNFHIGATQAGKFLSENPGLAVASLAVGAAVIHKLKNYLTKRNENNAAGGGPKRKAELIATSSSDLKRVEGKINQLEASGKSSKEVRTMKSKVEKLREKVAKLEKSGKNPPSFSKIQKLRKEIHELEKKVDKKLPKKKAAQKSRPQWTTQGIRKRIEQERQEQQQRGPTYSPR